jgi:ABC-type spermidine/putrescine transport system permease subunit II
MIRTGVTPEVNAVSAIFLLVSVGAISIAFLFARRVSENGVGRRWT